MDGLGGVGGLSEAGTTAGSQPECCHGEMQAQYPQDLQLGQRGWKLKYLYYFNSRHLPEWRLLLFFVMVSVNV